jgi:hypothetical protein
MHWVSLTEDLHFTMLPEFSGIQMAFSMTNFSF